MEVRKLIQNIGIPGLILVLVIALIIFGPSKLPEIGRAFGSTLKEFKQATNDLMNGQSKDSRDSGESEDLEVVENNKNTGS